MRKLAVILLFVAACFAISEKRPKISVVTGRVVAHAEPSLCINGYKTDWFILQLQSRRPEPKFIIVGSSVRCESNADVSLSNRGYREFLLIRRRDLDERLTGSVDADDLLASKGPFWMRGADAKTVHLPFGEVLHCYASADNPIEPAV